MNYDQFHELFSKMTGGKLVVYSVSIELNPAGVTVTCGGSDIAGEVFSDMFSADTFDKIKKCLDNAALQASDVIQANKNAGPAINLKELTKQLIEAQKDGKKADCS